MSQLQKLDQETRLLAAMAYGEASAEDVEDEMKALASVLVRQRNARGYASMTSFTSTDKTFSFVVKDGNKRFEKLMTASEAELEKTQA
jgi:ribosomal protein L27